MLKIVGVTLMALMMYEGVVIIKKFSPPKENSKARINLRREQAKGQKLSFCFGILFKHQKWYIYTFLMHTSTTHRCRNFNQNINTWKMVIFFTEPIFQTWNLKVHKSQQFWNIKWITEPSRNNSDECANFPTCIIIYAWPYPWELACPKIVFFRSIA